MVTGTPPTAGPPTMPGACAEPCLPPPVSGCLSRQSGREPGTPRAALGVLERPWLPSPRGRRGAGAPAGEQGGGAGGEGGDAGEEQAGGVQGGDRAVGAGPGGEQGGDEPDAEGAGDALADVEHGAGVGELGRVQGAGDGVEQRGDDQADRGGAAGQDGGGDGQRGGGGDGEQAEAGCGQDGEAGGDGGADADAGEQFWPSTVPRPVMMPWGSRARPVAAALWPCTAWVKTGSTNTAAKATTDAAAHSSMPSAGVRRRSRARSRTGCGRRAARAA
jgi:hypothetical protein